LLALGSIGLLVRLFWRPLSLEVWQQRALLLFLVTLLGATVSAMLRMHPLPPEGQRGFLTGGRYTFFVLLPLLLLMVLGLQTLLPMRWKPYGLPLILALFAIFNLTSWVWTIPHFYYWSLPL
jgi:hypothetical protein